MSTTQSAHVCTTTLAKYGLWLQASACSYAAMALLKTKWSAAKKPEIPRDALLLGWLALKDQYMAEEKAAIESGLLLHIGVAKAAAHDPNEAWRDQLIKAAQKVPTC